MTVFLVGSGPGDPELLTLKAARLLAEAEVVVHDALVGNGVFDLINPEARLIDVGKRAGGSVDQPAICRILVREGLRHERVVRLKGGDPFVFGRGGEEARELLAAGVPFEVVAGITSAVAAPQAAGIPITHRGLSAACTVVTGHRRHGDETATNWEALAQVGGTIVILMGVGRRAEIARRLMAGGLEPSTPVAAVRWGTLPNQEVIRTSLGRLGATPVASPATIVVGAVAALDLRSIALSDLTATA